ncbi:DHH family phosphoesterase [Treponema sp.]
MGLMNDSLGTFLKSASEAAHSGKPARIFLGNEASDLDSMASSILFAWSKGAESNGLPNIPVMNIPREDFNLRTEALWLFSEAGIDLKSLVFLDEIDLAKLLGNAASKLVLVDHNKLSNSQAIWESKVEEILDHHADENLYPAAKKTLAPVGSASTLVSELLLASGTELPPAVAKLALGTILLDTVNLDPEAKRVTPRDTAVASKLLPVSGADQKVLFDRLQLEKFNVAALSSRDILRKDYKEFRMGSVICGMSSALLPFADWFKKDAQIEAAFTAFAAAQKLDVLIVMGAYTAPEFTREMAVYSTNAGLRSRLVLFMNESGLALSPLHADGLPSGNTEYFSQGDLSQSRKKLQPLLSAFLQNA